MAELHASAERSLPRLPEADQLDGLHPGDGFEASAQHAAEYEGEGQSKCDERGMAMDVQHEAR